MTQQLQDSGERRTFKSGAVRDRGTLKPRPDLISPHAQMREGMIYALGAEKYNVRNWEAGMPISECLASAQRHIEQYKRGDVDEDHLAQARWNLGAILHYEEEIEAGRMDPAIDDMPHYAAMADLSAAFKRVLGVDLAKEKDCTVVDTVRIIRCTECGTPFRDGELMHISDPATGDFSHAPGQCPVEPKHLYVAGPMRGHRFFNFPAFDEAKKLGESLGYVIISPADLDRANGIDPTKWSPELIEWYDKNGWVDLHPDHKHGENWLRDIITRDTQKIIALKPERGDGLILLQNWVKSTGTCAEVPLALWLGLRFGLFFPSISVLQWVEAKFIKRELFSGV